jgi:hypothetical protein
MPVFFGRSKPLVAAADRINVLEKAGPAIAWDAIEMPLVFAVSQFAYLDDRDFGRDQNRSVKMVRARALLD